MSNGRPIHIDRANVLADVCHLTCAMMLCEGVKRLNACNYLLESSEIVIEVTLLGMFEHAKP